MQIRVGDLFFLSNFQHLTQNTMLLLIYYQLRDIHGTYVQKKKI